MRSHSSFYRGKSPRQRHTRFRRLQAALEANKIFFDIFLTAAISMAAIYVSHKANVISDANLKMAEKSSLPNFDLLLLSRADSAKNEVIQIFNRGGTNWTSPEIDICTFLAVPQPFTDDETFYPIDGVIEEPGWTTGETEGQIWQYNYSNTRQKERQLTNYLLGFDNRIVGRVEVRSYVRIICYLNSQDKDSTYFVIRRDMLKNINTASKIDRAIGQSEFDRSFRSVPVALSSLNFSGFRKLLKIDG
jgi:hypothetical protein